MYTDHQPNWRLIIGTIVASALVLFSVLLWLFDVSPEVLGKALGKIGIVLLIVLTLWEALRRYAWQWSWIRRWFSMPPDLRGRWVGTRTVANQCQQWVFEVYDQDLLNVRCQSFGPKNKADGYNARILSEPGGKKFKLIYVYDAKSDDTSAITEGYWHDGVGILELDDTVSPRTLAGRQINARPVVASVHVTYTSRQTKGSFE